MPPSRTAGTKTSIQRLTGQDYTEDHASICDLVTPETRMAWARETNDKQAMDQHYLTIDATYSILVASIRDSKPRTDAIGNTMIGFLSAESMLSRSKRLVWSTAIAIAVNFPPKSFLLEVS